MFIVLKRKLELKQYTRDTENDRIIQKLEFHSSLHLKVPELTSLKTRNRRFTTIYSFTTIVKFTKFAIIHTVRIHVLTLYNKHVQYGNMKDWISVSHRVTFDTT